MRGLRLGHAAAFRALHAAVALHTLSVALAALAAGAWLRRRWGWAQRLGVWGLVLHVVLLVAAVPLSLQGSSRIQQQSSVLHKVLWIAAVVCPLLEQLSGLATLTGSTWAKALLLQGLLGGPQQQQRQQQQRGSCLGSLLLLFSSVHIAQHVWTSWNRAPGHEQVAAAVAGADSGIYSALHLSTNLSSCFMVVVLMHNMYLQLLRWQDHWEGSRRGSSKDVGALRTTTTTTTSIHSSIDTGGDCSSSSSGSSRSISSRSTSSRSGRSGDGSSYGGCGSTRIGSTAWQQPPAEASRPWDRQPGAAINPCKQQLQDAAVLQMAAVLACEGLTLGLAAVQSLQPAASQGSVGGSRLQQLGWQPVQLAAAGWLLLVALAGTCWRGMQQPLQRWHAALCISLVVSVVARVRLLQAMGNLVQQSSAAQQLCVASSQLAVGAVVWQTKSWKQTSVLLVGVLAVFGRTYLQLSSSGSSSSSATWQGGLIHQLQSFWVLAACSLLVQALLLLDDSAFAWIASGAAKWQQACVMGASQAATMLQHGVALLSHNGTALARWLQPGQLCEQDSRMARPPSTYAASDAQSACRSPVDQAWVQYQQQREAAAGGALSHSAAISSSGPVKQQQLGPQEGKHCRFALQAGGLCPTDAISTPGRHTPSNTPSPLDSNASSRRAVTRKGPHRTTTFSICSISAADMARRASNDLGVSDLQATQVWVGDLLNCILQVMITVGSGTELVRAGLSKSHISVVARTLGTAGAVVYTISMIPVPLLLIFAPGWMMAKRDMAWPMIAWLCPAVHQVALQLLQEPSPFSLRVGLLQLACTLALLDISISSFSTWLPLTMTIFYSIDAIRNWATMSWGLRAWVAVEYNLLPIAAYTLLRSIGSQLKVAMVDAVYAACKALGGNRVTSRQRGFRVAAAVLVQQVMTMLVTSVWLAVSAKFGTTDAAVTAPLMQAARLLLLKESTHSAVIIVAVCLLLGPALQLGLLKYFSSGGTPVAAQAPCTSQHPLLTEQLVMSLCILTSLFTTVRMLQAAWTAPLGWLATAGLVAISGLQAATVLAHLVAKWRAKLPGRCVANRPALWMLHIAVLPCLMGWGAAVLGLPQQQAPLLLLVVRVMCLAAAGVTPGAFGSWLPLLAIMHHGLHAWHVLPAGRPWQLLALDAWEYGCWPILGYHFVHLIQNALLTAEQWARRGADAAAAEHAATGYCQLVIQGAAAVLQLCCWHGGVMLPISMGTSAAREAAKQSVWAVAQHLVSLATATNDTMDNAYAVLGAITCFLFMAGLQAVILASPIFAHPREGWYTAARARVMTLEELTIGRLAEAGQATRARHMSATRELWHCLCLVIPGCFPRCTVQLVLLEEGPGCATQHLLQAAPEASDLPQEEKTSLEALASVQEALRRGTHICRMRQSLKTIRFKDWAKLYNEYGMDSFLVVPLSCNNRDLGALLVTCISPVSLDSYQVQLAGDLGVALSQTLYTLACIDKMRAGDQLIQDMLPREVAQQLRRWVAGDMVREASGSQPGTHMSPAGNMTICFGGVDIPVVYRQWHANVSVLFADIVDFPALSAAVEPEEVMVLLHELFSKYDALCCVHGIYKMETVGDCYMACAGVQSEDPAHATHLVAFGQALLGAAASVAHPLGGSVHIRVGVHTGRVMSGVVGSIRARYCLFGDTVNTASRMQSTGLVDRVQLSSATFELLGQDLQAQFEERSAVAVKGKGEMTTWVLKEEVSQSCRAVGVAP